MTAQRDLSPMYLARLLALFERKGWRPFKVGSVEEPTPEFSRFTAMFRRLSDEERELVLKLSESFLWLGDADYMPHLQLALDKVDAREYPAVEDVFLVPLLKRQDEEMGREKSSSGLPYNAKRLVVRTHSLFLRVSASRVHTLSNIRAMGDKYSGRGPSLVIFLDDYVGSGGTAKQAIEYFNEYRLKTDEVVIVALVAQQEGLEVLRAAGYKVVTSVLRDRGVSDSTEIMDKEYALDMLKAIGRRLMVRKDLRLGYKESEGLVALKRTPNNTFPVFWWEGTDKLPEPWPAPFPR